MTRITLAALLLVSSAQAEPLTIIVSPHDHYPVAPWEPVCPPKVKLGRSYSFGTFCDPLPNPLPPLWVVKGPSGMTVLPRSYDKDGKLLR